MAKSLKNILEVYAPKSKDEKRFKDKHIVLKSKLDDKGTQDDKLFNATNIKMVDREMEHGYNPGKDEKVYEAVHPMALHVKPVSVNGKTKYKVHAVGKELSDGIKVGEHLSDTELEDATDMGAKIKHLKEDTLDEKKLTPAEMKKREEVAKAIKRDNPKMPMGKKMAIATATAKKVAEDVEGINESESSHKSFQDQHNMAAKHLKGITKALSDHYNNVTDKKQYHNGEAQWHHVGAIKNINRALEDLHMEIARETDFNRPPKQKLGESVDLEEDEKLSDLLSAIYENLSEQNKEIFDNILENNPDQIIDFLEQLEIHYDK
jgi:hypothetical protein